MSDPAELGLREDDFKRMWPRALARIMGQLQELTDSLVDATSNSSDLLSGAMVTSQEGVQRLNEAGMQLKIIADDVQRDIRETVDKKSEELVVGISAAVEGIRDAGVELILQSGRAILTPVTTLNEGVERLIRASNEAEISRVALSDARMKLIDYRRDLDVYEVLVLKRCKDAISKATSGPTLMDRVLAVFWSPSAIVNMPKPPVKPTIKK